MIWKAFLVTEAERFYVFKKIIPKVGYNLLQSGQVLFTAYPELPLEIIRNCFSDLKIPLVSIDCNYTATLRGLVAMGIIGQEVVENVKWGLMILSDFNVFMAVVEGDQIEKILEAPLSIQVGEDAAILTEIKDDFHQFYGYEIMSRIILVNNSFKLYSPLLIEKLQFEGKNRCF